MILVVDDDNAIRLSLKLLLERNGYEVTLAADSREATDILRSHAPELALLDMNFSRATSGDEGLTLLRQAKLLRPEMPAILMTAWGNIPLAVAGIQAGAFDFITKPWNTSRLLDRIATAIKLNKRHSGTPAGFDRSKIIGRSAGLMNVLDTVERIARTDASVLIMGENGTGKELIAEAIHRNSKRASGPFVKVNLGGIPQSLFESEMFGHKRGAFTGAVADRIGRFAAADGGTIFLDEIGELDLNCQVKLLRVLQEHTYEVLGDSTTRAADVRVICATNAPLSEMVAQHTFREDLFYRINLITVTLPPLRERKDDIPLIVDYIIDRFCESNGIKEIPPVADDAIAFLSSLPFPGNVRQLRNLVEGALLMSGGRGLYLRDLQSRHAAIPENTSHKQSGDLGSLMADRIANALAQCSGNVSRAAALLGISRQALYRKMDKYGINL